MAASKPKSYLKAGWLFLQDEAAVAAGAASAWPKIYGVLRGHELLLLASEGKEDEPRETIPLESVEVHADATKSSRRYQIDLVTSSGNAAQVGPMSAAEAEAAGSKGTSVRDSKVPSPFKRLEPWKSAASWKRRGLILQKLRLCSVVFEGVDGSRFIDDREVKRNTLLEIVDYCDTHGRTAFQDARLLEDTFTMVRLNLFRTLPRSPPPTGDPDEEEETFTDPQWAHLNIVYELLLRLVSMDTIDLALKKKAVDPPFVRQLLGLFDSEDARERDYLKTITHRIYSKLTQRRALIRRVICNVFFEFTLGLGPDSGSTSGLPVNPNPMVAAEGEHRGIAEMLEILASIINGFAVPIKDEHKVMLCKALIPLHKCRGIAAYHPQLSYCMALYAAKDHTLTRDIIPGMLKYWPISSSPKSIMFLNELEDIFEYCLEDDVAAFREVLTLRLAKCIRGQHFQVCERTLLLWNSERFSALMLEHPGHRAKIMERLFPALYENQSSHWHESIRTLSSHVLEHYKEVDAELINRCTEDYEARATAQAIEAESQAQAAAARGMAVGSSRSPSSPSFTAQAGVGVGSLALGLGMAASSYSQPTGPPTLATANLVGTSGRQGLRMTVAGGAAGIASAGAGAVAIAGPAPSVRGGAATGGVGSPAGAGITLSPGSGGSGGTGSGGHGRAPAVRSSSSFPVSGPGIENADGILPHVRGSSEGSGTPKRSHGHGLGGHGLGGLSMPLPMPSSADAGGAGEDGKDE